MSLKYFVSERSVYSKKDEAMPKAHMKQLEGLPLAKSGIILTSKYIILITNYDPPNKIGIHESPLLQEMNE